uniref:Uncharacterized protein n=1 Tax=Physcomitrium patens TaxID=3218 RepID=A0A7I4BWI9_PHYPA
MVLIRGLGSNSKKADMNKMTNHRGKDIDNEIGFDMLVQIRNAKRSGKNPTYS